MALHPCQKIFTISSDKDAKPWNLLNSYFSLTDLKQQINRYKLENESLQKDRDDTATIRDSHKHRLQVWDECLDLLSAGGVF